MKSNFKKLPGSKVVLEVTLNTQEFSAYWQTAYDQALAQVQIKGFRPGTAPKELAGAGVDQEKVFDKASENAVRFSLNEVSEENQWMLIDRPKIEVLEAAPLMIAGANDAKSGFKYKAELTIFPEVQPGDYKKIAKKVLAEKKEIKITAGEIDKSLDWLRQSRAKTVLVDRPAAKSDLVEVDIDSFVGDQPVAGGRLKQERFVIGDSRFMPGFDDQLTGHKAGELLEFSLTAPADYWQKDLQNKKIDFRVTILSVFDRQLPIIDDQFVKDLGPNFSNLDQLKENIGAGIKLEQEQKEQERLRLRIIEDIIKDSKIDPPQIMIEKTLDGLMAEVKTMFKDANQNYSDADLRKNLETRAKQNVLANLVMHKIVQAEHLEPSENEIIAEAQKQSLDPEKNHDYIYGIVSHRKLFEFLESVNQ